MSEPVDLDLTSPEGLWPLEEELRERVRQQEAAGSIGISALVGTDLPELMRQVVDAVSGVLSVEYCEMLELLPDGSGLLLRAGAGWREGLVGSATVGVNLQSQAGYTLMYRGPVMVEDLSTENRFDAPWLLREHGVISGISTAIRTGGGLYGVLGAHTVRKRNFSDDEVSFLQEVADVLGAAIQRKRSECDTESLLGERTEEVEAAERRFVFLAEANEVLSASTDLSTVPTTAARLAVPALADWCFVEVMEDGGIVGRLGVAHADPGKENLAADLKRRYPLDPNAAHGTPRVIRTGRPELVPEVDETILAEIDQPEVLHKLNPKSYLCVPLRVGGRTLGAIGLISTTSERCYGEEDLALAEGLAHGVALAIDNARHHLSEAELARELVRRASQDRKVVSPPRHENAPTLTPRQTEVLELLSSGRSTREIGRELYLSEATVRNHIRALLQAFGAHSQLEVLARAREMGVLS